MAAKICKWGNSYAVRLPKQLLKDLNWDTDTKIEFKVVNKSIVLSEHNPYDLDVLFKEYKGNYKGEEFNWGSPVGKEII